MRSELGSNFRTALDPLEPRELPVNEAGKLVCSNIWGWVGVQRGLKLLWSGGGLYGLLWGAGQSSGGPVHNTSLGRITLQLSCGPSGW